MSRYLLRISLVCALACPCGGVRAEVSLGLVSDYRYRGLSLTDGQPALQAGFAWDHENGWYAGAFAATTRIGRKRGLQAVSYLGRAWRMESGRSWEAGIQYVAFSRHRADDYRELYVGLSSDRWTARAYFQPKPLGGYAPAAYVEANASIPVGERWVLLGHLGAGWRGGDLGRYVDRVQYDGRLGAGVNIGAFSVHLQRVMTVHGGGYLSDDAYASASDDGWVLGATWTW